MARHNDKGVYPIDSQLGLDDFLLGADADNQDKTRNYLLGGIFSTFKSALSLSSIEYIFAGQIDPEIDHLDAGYFTTNNNNTSAPSITTILINKIDVNGVSIQSLIETVAMNPSSFTLRLFKPSSVGQLFYFGIDDIIDQTTHYEIDVTNFVGGNTLEEGTTLGLVFDLSGVPSQLIETDPVFLASPSSTITTGKIAEWNTAFGWGNHALGGYQSLLNGTGLVKSTAGTISYLNDNSTNWNTAFGWGNHALAGYLTSENDPVFLASLAATITSLQLSQWNTAFGWGNHASAGYLTSFSETDPVFLASPSAGITSNKILEWNVAFQWGNHASAGYLKSSNIDTLLELNSIVSDATIVDTTYTGFDSRYYTETEIDSFLATKANLNGATFSGNVLVPDEVYGVGWNGSTQVPTKNAIYDKIESLSVGGGTWGSITGTLSNQTDLQNAINAKENSFSKNTGFNKNFGTVVGTVLQGNWRPTFTEVTNKPTTIGGYGITDFNSLGDTRWVNKSGDTMTGNLVAPIISANGDFVSVRAVGTSTGNNNTANIGFYENNASTRQGLVGIASSINNDMFVAAEGSGAGISLNTSGAVRQRIDSSGVTTFNNIIKSKEIRNIGSSTGVSNVAFHSFYESNGNIRHGWFGFAGTANFGIRNETSTGGIDLATNGTVRQRIDSSGVTTFNNIIKSKEIRNIGSSTGVSNVAFHSFYESNGNIRHGWFGFGSSSNANFAIRNETSTGGIDLATNGTVRQSIALNGATTFTSTVTASNFILSSDRRLKKNITDIKAKELQVDWKQFKIAGDDNLRYGVIAQDLEVFLPQFVRTDEKGYKSVAYIDLLVAKMAEKDNHIAKLEDRLERIEVILKSLL